MRGGGNAADSARDSDDRQSTASWLRPLNASMVLGQLDITGEKTGATLNQEERLGELLL